MYPLRLLPPSPSIYLDPLFPRLLIILNIFLLTCTEIDDISTNIQPFQIKISVIKY